MYAPCPVSKAVVSNKENVLSYCCETIVVQQWHVNSPSPRQGEIQMDWKSKQNFHEEYCKQFIVVASLYRIYE